MVHLIRVKGQMGSRWEAGQYLTHFIQVNMILGYVFIQALKNLTKFILLCTKEWNEN